MDGAQVVDSSSFSACNELIYTTYLQQLVSEDDFCLVERVFKIVFLRRISSFVQALSLSHFVLVERLFASEFLPPVATKNRLAYEDIHEYL